jgi:hypothetical protein
MLESAILEDRKEFVRAFIGGVTVHPDTAVVDARMRQLPALGTANSTCQLVAGARFVLVQTNLQPLNRYLAGFLRAA